eukprot:scaffold4940_cov41-Phaeocystis_antarctica.AAC.1
MYLIRLRDGVRARGRARTRATAIGLAGCGCTCCACHANVVVDDRLRAARAPPHRTLQPLEDEPHARRVQRAVLAVLRLELLRAQRHASGANYLVHHLDCDSGAVGDGG